MLLIWRMCRGELSPLGQFFNVVILSRKRWCPYTYTAGLTCYHWYHSDGRQAVYFASGSLLVFLRHTTFVTKLFKHEYCCAHSMLVRIYCCTQTCQTTASTAVTIISAGENNNEFWKDEALLQSLLEQPHISTTSINSWAIMLIRR